MLAPYLMDGHSSLLTGDVEEEEEEQEGLYDSVATELEADVQSSESSTLDERARLDVEESQLNARIAEAELTVLRQRTLAKQQRLLALQAEVAAGAAAAMGVGSSLPFVAAVVGSTSTLPAVMGGTVTAPVAVAQTPIRPLRPRVLTYQSTVGRKPPTAAALLYQAGVDGLPDLAPVVGQPVTRVVVEMKEVVPPVVQARPLPVPPIVESRSKTVIKPVQPVMFTGDDATQNERVERWVRAVDLWLRLAKVPDDEHLSYARSLFSTSGTASMWIGQKDDELEAVGKEMTWDWLKGQVIQHYGSPSGAVAMSAEWRNLRMGVRNVDGSEVGGKSTWTVSSYNALFLHYMRALTSHSVQTEDRLVIDRYVDGIRIGYDALYKVMMGVQKILHYETLREAMDAAEVAEVAINVSRSDKRSERSTSAPSSSSTGYAKKNYGGRRPTPTEALNNMEGGRAEGEKEETTPGRAAAAATPSGPVQMYGFAYRPSPRDGRHLLTEAQARMLYDQRRCYRCYGTHPVGRDTPHCTAPVMKTAPQPLK